MKLILPALRCGSSISPLFTTGPSYICFDSDNVHVDSSVQQTRGNTEQTKIHLTRLTAMGVGGTADRAEDGGARSSGNGGAHGQQRGAQHGCNRQWRWWGEAAAEAVATAAGESVR
jgi:hypothetical protein